YIESILSIVKSNSNLPTTKTILEFNFPPKITSKLILLITSGDIGNHHAIFLVNHHEAAVIQAGAKSFVDNMVKHKLTPAVSPHKFDLLVENVSHLDGEIKLDGRV